MKILVTGGAGFIGSHVVDKFIDQGHEVVVLDNLTTGQTQNLNSQAKFYEADIRDPAIADIFETERPDVVSHHAAQIDVRKSVVDPGFDAEVNVLGSINLIQCAKRYCRRFLYASTGGAVYGEPRNLPITEEHPIKPLCPYGISKYSVELYLGEKNTLGDMQAVILRYPNVYGPRQNPKGEAGVVSIFVGQMMRGEAPTVFGEGHECRDYVYVEDIARASIPALDKGEGEAINLGWGTGVTVRQLYDILAEAFSFQAPPKCATLRPGEVEQTYLNAEKARRILGWAPQVDLKDGLISTAEFFKTNPDWVM